MLFDVDDFSPILNAFIEVSGKKIVKWCVSFLLIETWFDCIMKVNNFGFNEGYSIMHFIQMYMLGRCIYLCKDNFLKYPRYIWPILYLISTVVICYMYWVGIDFCWFYSNPIVVFSSIFSFVPFIYKEYHHSFINWIAKGTLAVYIIQVIEPVNSWIIRIDNFLLLEYHYPTYLLLSVFVLCFFFICCIIYEKICSIFINPILCRLDQINLRLKICNS